MRSIVVTLIVLLLVACDAGAPEHVYVRTSSVSVVVTARAADSRVRVGDWLQLRASRTTTGQWQKVRFADLPKAAPWLGSVPPEREPEVAANLRWYADPMDGVEFDNPLTRSTPPGERGVRFARPGTYRLWATSYAPQDATSNTLQIEVTARD